MLLVLPVLWVLLLLCVLFVLPVLYKLPILPYKVAALVSSRRQALIIRPKDTGKSCPNEGPLA